MVSTLLCVDSTHSNGIKFQQECSVFKGQKMSGTYLADVITLYNSGTDTATAVLLNRYMLMISDANYSYFEY